MERNRLSEEQPTHILPNTVKRLRVKRDERNQLITFARGSNGDVYRLYGEAQGISDLNRDKSVPILKDIVREKGLVPEPAHDLKPHPYLSPQVSHAIYNHWYFPVVRVWQPAKLSLLERLTFNLTKPHKE